MDIAELTQFVISHEATLVNIAAKARYTSLAGILPDDVVALIGQNRRFISIHRYHEMILSQLAHKMLIIEIAIGINQGLLIIGAFEHIKELMERVTELTIG